MAGQLKVERAVLVYQAGLANVFWVKSFNLSDHGREAKRLIQASFRECELYAQGLQAAGACVKSAACNQAGDVAGAQWSEDLEAAPFSGKFHPVGDRVDVDGED